MTFLLMFFLVLGTAALIFWNILMFISDSDNEKEIAYYAYRSGSAKKALLYEKYKQDRMALDGAEGFTRLIRKLFHNPAESEKKAEKIQKSLDKLDEGNFSGINFFVLPGYGFLRLFHITGDKNFFVNIMTLYSDLNGREYAVHDTRYLLSAMASCALGGFGVTTVLGVLFIAAETVQMGWMLVIGGPIFSAIAAFSLYDSVRSKSVKRREEIMKDLPQVVSEIALLTSSGMGIIRAWSEVSKDRNGALYSEMRQTARELENGFEPSVAFESFIRRCGTKDTSRLGASILQNLTRGNAELSHFLTELSHEIWEERKHHARRLGEQAQSKLMLPMMIIFIGIVLLIVVPIAVGMGDMGF